MDRWPSQPLAVDIPSDDDISAFSPSPLRFHKKLNPTAGGGLGGNGPPPPPTVHVIEDDPTPQKPNPSRTPSFVAETPLQADPAFNSDASVVKFSLACNDPPPLPEKFSGISGLICLESDNESEDGSCKRNLKTTVKSTAGFGLVECSEMSSRFSRSASPAGGSGKGPVGFGSPRKGALSNNDKNMELITRHTRGSYNGCSGTTDVIRIFGDSPPHDGCLSEDIVPQARGCNGRGGMLEKESSPVKQKGKRVGGDPEEDSWKNEAAARKKQLKEEKARLCEERKRKRQEEKLQKEALKAEAAEIKKLEKEKQKWEKGKFAIKSIVAEIDAKVVENGSVGGHLLSRFAEKGLSFRITSNPIGRSVLWKMSVPDQISQVSSIGSEVPYVLLIYQAEEFCDLVISESLIDHVHRVQSLYPSYTVCYLTNKLMSYINKCEQNQYKNPSNTSCWRRPPVEEALSKLTTHFTRVHSRQCIDEAELAEHVVGLTSSLANCQFRKKLTQLSVNANGSIIPKDFIDRNLIKKSVWLKSLVAIPKVQPRYAIAIWKKFPTMKSLLNVYMDPNKSVHEKEFLLKDLMIEGLLGKEDRRLGEMCSKRVYRILMAQSGGIKTDDVEDGADLFGS